MAMNLFDRPSLAHHALDPRHRGVTAIGSISLHAAIALTLLLAFKIGPEIPLDDPSSTALLPQHLVWVPSVNAGGGQKGGGDRTPAPPRRVQEVGHEAASVPAAPPQPSLDLAAPPPEEITAIPAKTMGDATLAYAGTIDGDAASRSAGPGSVGAGDTTTSNTGSGKKPFDGFGDSVAAGGPGVTNPTLIERVSPRYTVDAMRAGIQGSVWVECVVMPDGSVGDVRVLRSLDRRFGLDEEAIAAARRWKFRPGRLNGKPVAVIVSIELMFSVR